MIRCCSSDLKWHIFQERLYRLPKFPTRKALCQWGCVPNPSWFLSITLQGGDFQPGKERVSAACHSSAAGGRWLPGTFPLPIKWAGRPSAQCQPPTPPRDYLSVSCRRVKRTSKGGGGRGGGHSLLALFTLLF